MDAFLLLAAATEARAGLLDAVVTDVLPAGTDGIWLAFQADGAQDSLLLSADQALPRLVRGGRRPPGDPSALARLARRLLGGARLRELAHRGLDRLVRLRFRTDAGEEVSLVGELFGRRPGIVLVDGSELILEAIPRRAPAGRPRDIGLPYLAPPASRRPDPGRLPAAQVVAALAPGLAAGVPATTVLRQALGGVGPVWADEAVARAGGGSPEALAESLAALLDRIRAGPWEPTLLLDDGGQPLEAAPIRLAHLPDHRQVALPSLSEAVERLARARGRSGRLAGRRHELSRVLKRVQDRLRSRRARLQADLDASGRADLQQRMGDLLVRHQQEVPRGAAEAVLPDLAGEPGATLAIPLDPTLSPYANAERLFKAARRARRGAVRVSARAAQTDAELERISAWLSQTAAGEPQDLDAVQQALEASRLLAPRDLAGLGGTASPGSLAGRRRSAAPTGLEPRRFTSTDGLTILVGRNPESNDHLTLHLARSADLWLHVQDRPGSHVVVKAVGRPGGIPRQTVIEAAQLAAYYSQAREDTKVVVDFTLRKYVRKPRKAAPGLVTISQEKSVVVTPNKSLVTKLAASPDRSGT
jgi:predicted ribosome quality control (RQC) complex YloA/Tae2 family protein